MESFLILSCSNVIQALASNNGGYESLVVHRGIVYPEFTLCFVGFLTNFSLLLEVSL